MPRERGRSANRAARDLAEVESRMYNDGMPIPPEDTEAAFRTAFPKHKWRSLRTALSAARSRIGLPHKKNGRPASPPSV